MHYLVARIWRGKITIETIRLFSDGKEAVEYRDSFKLWGRMWKIEPNSKSPPRPVTVAEVKEILGG